MNTPTDNQQSLSHHPISLRDILTILFSQKWTIILVSGSLFTLVAILTFATPKVYRSYAKILLRIGRENVSVDPSVVGPTIGISRNRENEINSELSIITSRNVIESVIDELGVERILALKKPASKKVSGDLRLRAIRKIERNLSVEREKKSNNISVKFDATDPTLARDILNQIISAYQHRHIEIYRSQASLNFFQGKVDAMLQKIEKKEAVLAAFQREHELTDPGHQKERLSNQIMEMENRLDQIKRRLMSLHARRNILKNELKSHQEYTVTTRVAGMPNRTAEALKERLVELQIQEADIIAKYPKTSTVRKQLLIPVRESIALVQESLGKETNTLTEETTSLDTVYQETANRLRSTAIELSELMAEQSTINPILADRREQLDHLIEIEYDLKKMKRDVSYDWDEYRQYRTGLQRSKVAEALDIDQISNVSIIQSATRPIHSISPDKPRDLMLGLIISIMAGIGLAFVRDHFDDTIKSESDISDYLGQVMLTDISAEEFKQCH